MKNIFSALGFGLMIAVLIPFTIIITIFFLIWVGVTTVYDGLLVLIRNDPRIKIVRINQTTDLEVRSYPEFYERFNENALGIASSIPAKLGKLKIDSDGKWEKTDPDAEFSEQKVHKISRLIESEGIRSEISVSAIEVRNQRSNMIFGIDGDDGPSPSEITVKIDIDDYQKGFLFDLNNERADWFFVGLMRGDYKINHSQFWVYLKEKDVWIVRYKDENSWYGLRSKYTQVHARQHWFDTKIYTK